MEADRNQFPHKLIEEQLNASLKTIHEQQMNILNLEQKMAEKDKVIKVLESKILSGSCDSTYEVNRKQREYTIKHLESQISNLMDDTLALKSQNDALRYELDTKCDCKRSLSDYKLAGKNLSTRKITKTSSSNAQCQNDCEQRLRRIIEHKDNRIFSLSKDIEKLKKSEVELTNKVYRLTKLLPWSRNPPETITDCLLREIERVETELRGYKEKYGINLITDSNRNMPSLNHVSALDGKVPSVRKRERASNEIAAFRSLQALYDDILELKFFFADQNEKFQQCVARAVMTNDVQTSLWDTVFFKINSIHDTIRRIVDSKSFDGMVDSNILEEKEQVILKLQERLQKLIEINSEHEKEIAIKEKELQKLRWQLTDKEVEKSVTQASGKSTSETSSNDVPILRKQLELRRLEIENVEQRLKASENLVAELKNMVTESQRSQNAMSVCEYTFKNCLKDPVISTKQIELEASLKIIQSYENLIGQLKDVTQRFCCPCVVPTTKIDTNEFLQKIKEIKLDAAEKRIQALESVIKNMTLSSENFRSSTNWSKSITQPCNQCTIYEKRLDVSQKNILSCEKLIKHQQEQMSRLEEEKKIFKLELDVARSDRVSHSWENLTSSLKSNLAESESRYNSEKQANQDLRNKMQSLEAENVTSTAELRESVQKMSSLESKMNSEKSKLDAAKKDNETLQANVDYLTDVVTKLKQDNIQTRIDLHTSASETAIDLKEQISSLKLTITHRDEEITSLKKSLQELKDTTLQLHYYRKILKREIKNLSTAIEGMDEGASQQKTILKSITGELAEALLKYDSEHDPESDLPSVPNALNEMKHQISVYITEVARITELLGKKEDQRREIFREYLNEETHSTERFHEISIEELRHSDLESSPVVQNRIVDHSTAKHTSNRSENRLVKDVQADKSSTHERQHSLENINAQEINMLGTDKVKSNDAESSGIVQAYLFGQISKLEDSLEKLKLEQAKCQTELEHKKEAIKDLRHSVQFEQTTNQKLSAQIDLLRTKESSYLVKIEQLGNEVQKLVKENKNLLEKVLSGNEQVERLKLEIDELQRNFADAKLESDRANYELRHMIARVENSHRPDDS